MSSTTTKKPVSHYGTELSIPESVIQQIRVNSENLDKHRHNDTLPLVIVPAEKLSINHNGVINVEAIYSHLEGAIHHQPAYGYKLFFTPKAKQSMGKTLRRLLEGFIYMKHAKELSFA